MKRLLFVFGTRPEAIKLCPLVRHLRSLGDRFEVKVCVTAQHRDMLDQVLKTFAVTPEYDLDLMLPRQTLSTLTANILSALQPVLEHERPDVVIVQGDTTSTLAGALGAFYHRIAVAHVEAGLRTGDMNQPFPEEMNRVLTTRLSALHFAPTQRAAAALEAEGVPSSRITVTGNTGIDAVLFIRDALDRGELTAPSLPWLDPTRRLVLVTSHRRENFGEGFRSAMRALGRLADRDDVQLVYPVHRNPNVSGAARQMLSDRPNVVLLDPAPYVPFVDLMRRSHLIITDSGGVQEEAPSLGKPVLVLRDKTERPEAVEAGTVRLVGTDESTVYGAATELLDNPEAYEAMTRVHNPYGDGHACDAIAVVLQGAITGAGR